MTPGAIRLRKQRAAAKEKEKICSPKTDSKQEREYFEPEEKEYEDKDDEDSDFRDSSLKKKKINDAASSKRKQENLKEEIEDNENSPDSNDEVEAEWLANKAKIKEFLQSMETKPIGQVLKSLKSEKFTLFCRLHRWRWLPGNRGIQKGKKKLLLWPN